MVDRFAVAGGAMEAGDEAAGLEEALRAAVLHALAEAGIQAREAAPPPAALVEEPLREDPPGEEAAPEPDLAHLLSRENAEHEETVAPATPEPPLYRLEGRVTSLTRDQARSAAVGGTRRTSYTTVIGLSFTLRDARTDAETFSGSAGGVRKVMPAQAPGETERRDMLNRAVNEAARDIARQLAARLGGP
jgi:hypothetical protein